MTFLFRPQRQPLLAPSVRAVGPGRHQQRHVIVRALVVYAEADRYLSQKRDLRNGETLPLEVIPHEEDDLVQTLLKLTLSDKRAVGAAVPICNCRRQKPARTRR